MRVYFDNASTTPMLPDVTNHMVTLMNEEYGNPSSIHWHGRKARAIIENSRKTVAQLLNASISEIFFTSSATEANNMVLKNVVESLGVQRIISSPTEHHCVLHTLEYLEINKNIEIIFLPVDQFGNINVDELTEYLNYGDKKTLVSLMHGNNEIGTMINLRKVGEICKSFHSLFHTDTVQSVGKYPIDVQADNISFLTGSGHKFHGPKGAAFVYISNENIITPLILGGAQERNMRAGTENVAGISGLSMALKFASDHMDENQTIINNLRNYFKARLEEEIEGILYNGNQSDNKLSHILSVSFPSGPKADLLVFNLDIAGIAVSSGSACASGIEEDSHVLKAIHHPSDRKTIRFSFSPFNTYDEINYTIDKLKTIV